jgi:hypothetical protein
VTARRNRELLEQLRSWAGDLPVGRHYRGALAAGDGLVLKIEVRVERRAPMVDIDRYRTELLHEIASGRRWSVDYSARERWERSRVVRCECYTQSRGWAKGGGRCEARAVAAIVYAAGRVLDSGGSSYRFKLVCGKHRERPGIDAVHVLGVVEFAAYALGESLRRGCECYAAARTEKVAAARAAGKHCKRCGVDGRCFEPPCDFEAPAPPVEGSRS